MKTAEEWQLEIERLPLMSRIAGHAEAATINLVQQIRLDAMKEGMRRAAAIADNRRNYETDQTGYQQAANWQCGAIKKAILASAERLTEKDL